MRQGTFKNHAVWSLLSKFRSDLEQVNPPSDKAAREDLHRLHATVAYLDALSETEPSLVEDYALDELSQHVQNLSTTLQPQHENEDAGQRLARSASHVPGLMNSVRDRFPNFPPDEANRAAKGAVTRYRNQLDAEVQRLRDTISSLTDQLDESTSRRDADYEEWREKFDELKARMDQHETDISAQGQRLSQQIDSQRATFVEESEQRTEAFRSTLESERKKAEEQRDTYAADLKAQLTRQEDDAQEVISSIEAHEERARALVHSTSNHAVTADYAGWAARQARAALLWTFTAVALGIATVAVLVWTTGTVKDDSIQFTLYKSSISVIGLIIAGYAARQAAEHRKEERSAKRLALDLNALEPFIEGTDDAASLRSEVARRVFVPDNSAAGSQEPALKGKRGFLTVTEISQLVTAFKGVKE